MHTHPRPLTLAIVGTGFIAQDLLSALETIPDVRAISLCARPHSRQKAEALAQAHGISQVYTDYDALLQTDTADFVYIGLVNTAHYVYTKKALLAGRHVILEKPFVMTGVEACELKALAAEKHVYLIEAVTCLHMPNFKLLQQACAQIGQVRVVQANYSQYSSRYDRYLKGEVLPAFNPELGGGALMDLNDYNLNLLVALFGKPQTGQYIANRGFNGVDTSGAAILHYPHFFATSVAAKDSASPSFFLVQGERGWVRVHGAPNVLTSVTVCLDGKEITHNENQYAHRMVHEFMEFARMYREQDTANFAQSLRTSIDVVETLEMLRTSSLS